MKHLGLIHKFIRSIYNLVTVVYHIQRSLNIADMAAFLRPHLLIQGSD